MQLLFTNSNKEQGNFHSITITLPRNLWRKRSRSQRDFDRHRFSNSRVWQWSHYIATTDFGILKILLTICCRVDELNFFVLYRRVFPSATRKYLCKRRGSAERATNRNVVVPSPHRGLRLPEWMVNTRDAITRRRIGASRPAATPRAPVAVGWRQRRR